MFERIVAALRKAGTVIFKNLWLLIFAFVYTFSGPVLMLGGTGLPILYWGLSGRNFNPELLRKNPVDFLVSHWQLVLYSLAGCLVGFIIYLLIVLFYKGALTAVVLRSALRSHPWAERVAPGLFWQEGRRRFSASAATATIASILPLPPMILLFGLAVLFAGRIFSMIALGRWESLTELILPATAGIGLVAVILILTFLALLWYRFALCAVCVDNLGPAPAMRAAISFVSRQWLLVLGLVIVWLSLGLVNIILSFVLSLSFVFSFIINLWLDTALVVLYIDNR
jgi:hypothetical protein